MKAGMPSFKKLTLTVALMLINMSADAAILPGAAMPDTVSRSLKSQEPQPKRATPQNIQEHQTQQSKAQQEAAMKIKFTLNGVILEGNHIYSTSQLSPLYKKQMHKTITVADLFVIVQGITNYYRNNGYIISRAVLPPQHVQDGVVKIQVVEGYLDKAKVIGDAKGAKCIVRAFGKEITKCRPLKLARMEEYLTLANEVPSTEVKAILAPSKTETGAADLVLNTTNHPITGYVSYDNYGTRYIGPQQMTANLALNSFILSGDSLQGTVTKTPKGNELSFSDVNYNTAIINEYTRLLVGSTRAHTFPLFVLESSQIDGLNNNYYSTLTYPLIRDRIQTWNISAGFNVLDSYVTSLGVKLYTDHIRSLDLGTAYSFADRWYGSNSLAADFRQGLPIWGYTTDTNQATAQTSRPGGVAQYTKLTFQASRLQAVHGPISLYGLVKGQYAFDPLLSSEQFTFGGNPIGRGYDVAELIGDKGLAGSLELRYDVGVGHLYLQSLQPYVFYDAGMIWNRLIAPGSPGKLSGTSAGVGLRFFMNKYVSGNFMWTQTLTKQVAAEEYIHQGRRPRLWFSLIASFG